MIRRLFIQIVKWYQMYLTHFSFGSCRHYPSCSHYCIWQLENNSFFKAIYFTMMRLLKCNQWFDGGVDYPIITYKTMSNYPFKKISVKYWYVPLDSKRCYVIKNWEWKNNQ